ncbi:MAG: Ig domain protein [Paenibacillaceae bacterium]|jgi:hypothetical protein|nr:Ig domain protein [Paenibacillaceae bacterium]
MCIQQSRKLVSLIVAVLLLIGMLPSAPQARAAEAESLTLLQHELGNIFLEGEEVVIPVTTTGDTVLYSVKDFWGHTTISESVYVQSGTASIKPQVTLPGYYEMSLAAQANGSTIATADTTFAIIRPTASDAATSRFGVMTHFAQSWNPDILPLVAKMGMKHIRDEHYWGTVEKTKGVYDFAGSNAFVQAASDNGIQVLPIMSFSNSLYDVDPAGTTQSWTIRRWVSNITGTINITGWWNLGQAQGSGSDGTGLRIFVDGQQVFFQKLVAKGGNITLGVGNMPQNIAVHEGSTVDIAVTPGDSNAANSFYDGANVVVDIWAKPAGATSATGYSTSSQYSAVQGQNQWYYGYADMPKARWDDYDPADFKSMNYNTGKTRWEHPSFQWSTQSKQYFGTDIKASAGVSPYTDEGRLGYANYGKAILDYYAGKGGTTPAIEVWNEYNGSFSNGPAAANKPYYYTEMLKKSYEVLKNAYPDIPVLGTASVQIPTGYLESLFKLGALDYMDAVVVHPYVQAWDLKWPELVWSEIKDLNGQIRQYNNGQLKPIWVTEFGYSSKDRRYTAKFNARQLALMSSFANVERMYTYLLRDDGSFPYMGLLKAGNAPEGKYTPNPAYVATANMIHQLNGAVPLGREWVDSLSNLYVMKYSGSNGQALRIAWSADEDGEIADFHTNEALSVVDIMGVETVMQPVNGKVSVPLGDSIVFVKGEVQSVTGNAQQPVADSFLSFSGHQGEAGWQYGYYDNNEFKLMHYTPEFTWNWQWQGEDDQSLKVTQPGGYPSLATGSQAAVRRWTSPLSGELRVQGLIGPSALNYSIRVDGNTVFQGAPEAGFYEDYDAVFPVTAGSHVDFVLQHPNGEINKKSDKTVFTARIYGQGAETALPLVQLTGPEDVYAGQPVSTTVSVTASTYEYTLVDTIVHYDPAVLEYEVTGNADGVYTLTDGAITPSRAGLQVLGTAVKPEEGLIRVILASTGASLSPAGELFQLNGKVRSAASAGQTIVTLTDMVVAGANNPALTVNTAGAEYALTIAIADRTTLGQQIASALSLHDAAVEGDAAGQYPSGAKAALLTAIQAASAVYQQTVATQQEVNDALAALTAAVHVFTASVNQAASVADKDVLRVAIEQAEALDNKAVAGSKVGQYPALRKTALQDAIAAAKAVLNASSSQSAVNAAADALNGEIADFRLQRITLIPGEAEITIRTLSVAAKYFGITSADPGWSEIQAADILDQHEITVQSLAAIARMILSDWLAQ